MYLNCGGQSVTVGWIVHYMTLSGYVRAAIVTDVNIEKELICLEVFNTVGENQKILAAYSEKLVKGHWSWPKRV